MVWYIWAILGVLAIIFEITSPTFFALFVGLGFLGSAAFAYFLPNALIWQIVMALVGMFVGLWVFKRRKIGDSPQCRVGQTDEFVGTRGKIVKSNTEGEQAEAVFSEPIFGRRSWIVVSLSDEVFQQNDPIEVVAVFSNHLTVQKISN